MQRLEDRTMLVATLSVVASPPTPAAGRPALEAGQPATFVVAVHNSGPDAATNVTLVDTFTLTGGTVTVISADAGGRAFTPPSPPLVNPLLSLTLADPIDPIAPNDTATFTIVVRPSIDGKISSSLTATPTNGAAASGSTAAADVLPAVRLSIVASPPTPAMGRPALEAGQPATFVVAVHNSGPDAATNVTLVDTFTLTGGTVTVISADADDGTPPPTPPPGNSLSLTLSSPIDPDATVTITIVVRPSIDGKISSAVTATPTNGAAASGSTAPADVVAASNLALINTAPATAVAGQNASFTVSVVNGGPSTATGLVLADKFTLVDPMTNQQIAGSSVTIVSITPAITNPDMATPSNAGDTATITFAGAVALNRTNTFTVVVKPSVNGKLRGSLSASVASPGVNTGISPVLADVLAAPSASLMVTLDPPTPPTGITQFLAGNDTTFKVTVKNIGPSSADHITLINTFALTMGSLNRSVFITGFSELKAEETNPASDYMIETSPSLPVTSSTSLAIDFKKPLPKDATAVFQIVVRPQGNGQLISAVNINLNGEVDTSPIPDRTMPVTILDPGKVGFDGSQTTATRSANPFTLPAINVKRTTFSGDDPIPGSVDGTVTVGLSVAGDKGKVPLVEGADFTVSVGNTVHVPGTPLTLTFAPGTNIVPIIVKLNSTDVIGDDSLINLTLSTPTGGVLINANSAYQITVKNANSLVVTETGDDVNVTGTLRQVLAAAKKFQGSSPFPVPITFNIPNLNGNNPPSAYTIVLVSPLSISSQVSIDGTSQKGLPMGMSIRIVANSAFDGLSFDTGSKNSTLEGVEVTQFHHAIKLIDDNITIRSSKIHGNTGDGIYVTGSGETIGSANALAGNSIYDNNRYGIEIVVSPGPTSSITTISQNVIGLNGSTVEVNRMGGVTFTGTGIVQILFNTITTSNFGIMLGNSAGAQIANNTITGTAGGSNGSTGLMASVGSNLSIVGTTIGGTLGTGIALNSISGASINASSISGSTAYGIAVTDGTGTTISGTTITGAGGDGVGVSASRGTDLSIIGPTINGTTGTGVSLSGVSNARITAGSISGTTVSGITVTKGAVSILPETTISAGTTISGTTITGAGGVGITASDGTGLTIATTTIGGTIGTGIDLSGISGTSIGSASISGATGDGISVTNGAVLAGKGTTISGTTITGGVGVTASGIVASGGSGLSILGTTIKGPLGTGIALSDGISGTLIDSATISGATGDGISVVSGLSGLSGLSTTIKGSSISGSGLDGIRILGMTRDTRITGNTIADSHGNGIEVSGSEAPGLAGNFVLIRGNDITGTATTDPSADIRGDGIYLHGLKAVSSDHLIEVDANMIVGSQGPVPAPGEVRRRGNGIELANAPGVRVTSNFIGVDRNGGGGGTSFGNTGDGVLVFNSDGVTVGSAVGSGSGPNLISQNFNGVEVIGSFNVTLQVNFIGTDTVNRTDLLNKGDGIRVSSSAAIKILGNVVAKSKGNGIEVVDSISPTIENNQVGIADLLKNSGNGLLLTDSPNGRIAGNTVDFSTLNGLLVGGTSATTLTISGNQFRSNTQDGVLIDGKGGASPVITANTINRNGKVGLEVSQAPGLIVANNFIGTDKDNSTGIGNKQGVVIFKSAGAQVTDNTISGNLLTGLQVSGSGSVVIEKNRIGVGLDGGAALGNMGGGVDLAVSGNATIRSNVISSNGSFGLNIQRSGSLDGAIVDVSSNRIGTNQAGNLARGNSGPGIQIGAVAGIQIQRNIISANRDFGVLVAFPTTPDATLSAPGAAPRIEFNTVGAGMSGTEQFGNGSDGIRLENTLGATVFGNTIVNNAAHGLLLMNTTLGNPADSSATVANNYVGTNAALAPGLGNFGSGIAVVNARSVTVTLNSVDSNARSGIDAVGSPGLKVLSNTIGGAGLGNVLHGVHLMDSDQVTIDANTISGNVKNGIFAESGSDNLLIQYNLIGLDATGTPALGNQGDGVNLSNSSASTVASNRIGANVGGGIVVGGTTSQVTLDSNTVGGGTFGNKGDGILITAQATTAGTPSVTLTSNLVSANSQNGLRLIGAQGVLLTAINTFAGNFQDGVAIEGGSQGNSIAGALVSGNQGNGVNISGSSNNTVDSNTIVSNQIDGVHIDTFSSGNVVSGNRIGLAGGNIGNGVAIVSTGTADVVANNTLSDNTIVGSNNSGVLISGLGASGNILRGNMIGSAAPIPTNRNDGISILVAGAGNRLDRNTIIGNDNNGVLISGTTGTSLTGNFIGTDSAGADRGNRNYGLFLNFAVGTVVEGQNRVNFNQSHGIVIAGGSGNRVSGSTIESNRLAGVLLLATSFNTIGGDPASGQENLIAANATDGVGIFNASSNLVAGNVIANDPALDARRPDRSVLVGSSGNKGDGVHIVSSQGNTISGNVISASQQSGVEIFGNSSGNMVLANILGTRSSETGLGNKLNGVLISGSLASDPSGATNPTNNTIQGNTIAGNQANGVAVNLATSNSILGNVIGRSADGPLGNNLSGVSVSFSTGTTIGGGNTIEGNQADGIALVGSSKTTISDNTISSNVVDGIGLDQSGLLIDPDSGNTISGNFILKNLADGVRIQNNSSNNRIGLEVPAGSLLANHILGNGGAGVEISTGSTANVVQGNLIGFDAQNVIKGNAIGVFLNQVRGNVVGGSSIVAGANTITGNNVYGIEIAGNAPGPEGPGNLVQYNFIGTNPFGYSPGAFSTFGTLDIGVYVLNSRNNRVVSNIVSGNHQAGIALFGSDSTKNTIAGNTIGSDFAQSGPIMTVNGVDPASLHEVYGAFKEDLSVSEESSVRQLYGVWIIGAPGNDVGPLNAIQGNQIGALIQGGTATGNVIHDNVIGSVRYTGNDPNVDGLGNLFGVYIANTTDNTVSSNTISRNISVGVAIVGSAATGNKVQTNTIQSNGGYARPNTGSFVILEPKSPGAQILGSGVYIESGQGNIIGSASGTTKPSKVRALRNTIVDNTQVGVYVFNFGSTIPVPAAGQGTGNAVTANSIAGNRISGVQYSSGDFNGDYGVLLFNSAGNIPGVPRVGVAQNTFGKHRIANFREFTGDGRSSPFLRVPPLPPANARAAAGSVKAAAIDGVPVTIDAGGKGHPLPPARKNPARKA